MQIGYSMSPQLLLGHPSSAADDDLLRLHGGVKPLLQNLKAQGVGWIELRYLPMQAKEKIHETLCHMVWESGLKLSVHGKLSEDGSGSRFTDLYPSMKETLALLSRYQSNIVLTLHAFVSLTETIAYLQSRSLGVLREWIAAVTSEGLPLRFGLELDHLHPGTAVGPGGTCGGVVRMVEELNSPAIGITWDMGHYYSNLIQSRSMTKPPLHPLDELPPKSFLEKTIHTHIHGLGDAGAHYPLSEPESLPLELYVRQLQKAGYDGVYNLELRYSTFAKNLSPAEHIARSIERLRAAANL